MERRSGSRGSYDDDDDGYYRSSPHQRGKCRYSDDYTTRTRRLRSVDRDSRYDEDDYAYQSRRISDPLGRSGNNFVDGVRPGVQDNFS